MKRNYNHKTQKSKRKYGGLSPQKMIYVSFLYQLENHTKEHIAIYINDLRHKTTQD